MNKIVIQYGGRGAGALLAYKLVGKGIGGWKLAVIVAGGWLLGGLVGDAAANMIVKE